MSAATTNYLLTEVFDRRYASARKIPMVTYDFDLEAGDVQGAYFYYDFWLN